MTAVHEVVRETLPRISDWDVDITTKAGKYKNRETLISLVVDYLDHFGIDPAETYIKSDGTPAVELSFRFELGWGVTCANGSGIVANCLLRRAIPFAVAKNIVMAGYGASLPRRNVFIAAASWGSADPFERSARGVG